MRLVAISFLAGTMNARRNAILACVGNVKCQSLRYVTVAAKPRLYLAINVAIDSNPTTAAKVWLFRQCPRARICPNLGSGVHLAVIRFAVAHLTAKTTTAKKPATLRISKRRIAHSLPNWSRIVRVAKPLSWRSWKPPELRAKTKFQIANEHARNHYHVVSTNAPECAIPAPADHVRRPRRSSAVAAERNRKPFATRVPSLLQSVEGSAVLSSTVVDTNMENTVVPQRGRRLREWLQSARTKSRLLQTRSLRPSTFAPALVGGS